MTSGLVRELQRIVGTVHVRSDPDVVAGFVTDWTGRFRGSSPAVVQPGSTEEVAAVLATCQRAGVAVVPQGGNTGLVGGGVPLHGEVVLSTRRLDGLGPVDAGVRQVTAGAGVPLVRLRDHAEAAGLAFGVDLAARDTATVGGMVATNAGGVHVIRHGAMRQQVVGVEAVLADGSVLAHLGGLEKDNTGYDLAGLLAGSEGTLAVVTRARLRLVVPPAHVVTVLVGVDTPEEAVRLAGAVRQAMADLEAVEAVYSPTVDLVAQHLGAEPPPGPAPVLVLLEAGGADDPADRLAAVLDRAGVQPARVAVATDERTRAGLWAWRERAAEAIATTGTAHKLDVTLPNGELARFVGEVPDVVRHVAPQAATHLFGHVADGNVHVNVVGDGAAADAVDEAVLQRVAVVGGSISAEHGIGTAKRRWLPLTRTAAEIAAMRAIKRALDPQGTLNPHALLPPA